jgi:hypothetical protein
LLPVILDVDEITTVTVKLVVLAKPILNECSIWRWKSVTILQQTESSNDDELIRSCLLDATSSVIALTAATECDKI